MWRPFPILCPLFIHNYLKPCEWFVCIESRKHDVYKVNFKVWILLLPFLIFILSVIRIPPTSPRLSLTDGVCRNSCLDCRQNNFLKQLCLLIFHSHETLKREHEHGITTHVSIRATSEIKLHHSLLSAKGEFKMLFIKSSENVHNLYLSVVFFFALGQDIRGMHT